MRTPGEISQAWPVTKDLLNPQEKCSKNAMQLKGTGPELDSYKKVPWMGGMDVGIRKVPKDLPMVVMTVAAKIIALGQFQLLKV